MKKFVIIDAMALAYRAYFVFNSRPLITSKGEPTSAVYGFINQLIKILTDTKPDYLAVAFDSKEKTFRHEMYVDYKSNRAVMPDDMIPQIDRIKQLIDLLNIPHYIYPGYEADDIIGSAVKKAYEAGLNSLIITPDKDYNQLINDRVTLLKPGKGAEELKIYDVARVKEELGFEPILMIDYLAIMGDSSDCIPGVKGIGEKGALKLVQQYGSLENIYANIESITPDSIKNKLIASKENAFMSKTLATIVCDMDMEFDFEKAKLTMPDFDGLREYLVELEFKTLYDKFLKVYNFGVDKKAADEKPESIELPVKEEEKTEEEINHSQFDKSKVKYKLIKSEKESDELAAELLRQELFVFDTETDSLNIFNLNLAGVSFSFKEDEAYFIPINPYRASDDLFASDLSDRLSIDNFIKTYKPIFENPSIKKVCQNGKYDISVMKNYGIEVKGFEFDTMLASYVIDPDQKHGMDELSKKYLKYEPVPLTTIIGNKKNAIRIFDAPVESLSDYSCEDADVTLKLYNIFKKMLKEESLEKLAYEVEFPLVEVLEDMERTGIKVDKQYLNSLSSEIQNTLQKLTVKIYEASGEEFNINSPAQLQKVLFDKLGLTKGKKTKTGFSTDAQSLEALKGEHSVIDYLLEYRQLSKLKSTYTDTLPLLIQPGTGRVHTSFNQTVASTGRLSSNEPNLQNIPIRTDLGKEIRKAFIPRDEEHIILSADYSQIELRIMASICEDKALMEAFRLNEDIHRSTAAHVFMVKPSEVTPDMRRKAKEVNFGILYGIGPFGLKQRLGIEQRHAKEIIDTYFNTFKNVKKFIEDTKEKARSKGFAETLLGRRRYLNNLNSNNKMLKQFEERVAVNMPIQGTAADMIKLAMINIYKELNKRNLRTKMVLQVHDELLFDVYKKELDEVKEVIKNLMENSLPLNVPVVAEIGTGENWLDAH